MPRKGASPAPRLRPRPGTPSPERGSRRGRRGSLLRSVLEELQSPTHSLRVASRAVDAACRGTLTKRQERMLRIITEESAALVGLIEDFLDLAELESGRMALKFRRCTVCELVRASLDRQRASFRGKGVELLDFLPSETPCVRADAARIRQAFDHLLANSLKFTPPGGRVEVRVRKEEPSSRPRGTRRITLAIEDTGQRVSGADLGVLFEASGKSGSTTRAAGGSGLGLSVARFLLEAHGAEVRAEDRGQGLAFLVTFPLAT